MAERYAVVVTTINAPTPAVRSLAEGSARIGADFVVVGDTKSPPTFPLDGPRFFDIQAQNDSGFRLSRAAPVRHYARKNIGYLIAIRDGATVLLETDDDNVPLEAFWGPRSRLVSAPVAAGERWCNVYSHFSDELIWPRGLPLDQIQRPTSPLIRAQAAFDCPIQQGLADANPDVDAVYRLTRSLPAYFKADRTVVLEQGAWCPFNSQNTAWWPPAYPLLYLPSYCPFRMTDIWRSLVAQRIAWGCGWCVMFHSPTVRQDRNVHDLMDDFADEIAGYLHNDRIRRTLEALPLRGGVEAIGDDLLRSYEALVGLEVVGAGELDLVRLWLEDLAPLLP
jgi:hypothetical protein